MTLHVVISGLPGSGKSTLARELAAALDLSSIDKDDLLEALFDAAGAVGDLAWRRRLSRLADSQLHERALQANGAVLTSWWKHPGSQSDSGTATEWLAELSGSWIEIHCHCSPEVAAARFMARHRHPGHLDGRWSPAELLASLEAQFTLGPLGIAPLLVVNSEAAVDPLALINAINGLRSS